MLSIQNEVLAGTGVLKLAEIRRGGMAEWLKAAVLKTARVKALVGSNPTSTAIFIIQASSQ